MAEHHHKGDTTRDVRVMTWDGWVIVSSAFLDNRHLPFSFYMEWSPLLLGKCEAGALCMNWCRIY